MSEFLAAIVGGLLSLMGTFIAVWYQFKKQGEEKQKDNQNDLVSMIDIVIFKAAKVRNNLLDFKTANYSKENTCEIYSEIHDDFKSLDRQIQELLTLMSHHIDNSNVVIQEFLGHYQPVEKQMNQFKKAYKIYCQKYASDDFDKNAIAFSKRKLDKSIGELINNLKRSAKKHYNHNTFEPKLNPVISKDEMIR